LALLDGGGHENEKKGASRRRRVWMDGTLKTESRQDGFPPRQL